MIKKNFFSFVKMVGRFLPRPVAKQSLWFGVVLFFIGLGLLSPLYFAYGQFGWMGDIASSIGEAIGSIVAKFWSAILAAILTPAAIILAWSIDPWFIKIPYTSGAIVNIGWPVTRDLANMFIVLILVIIGLATALRLEEYQARKTLPRLFFIALLINFTPVILGVIVDFTNIVMNFFLVGLTGSGALADTFLNINASIASSLSGFNFFDPVEFMSFVIKLMVMTLFMVFAAIIFLLFAMLFIMRRVAIWILVILSPIAFIAYILPATRGFFRFWWNQFTNWAIIGVFAAFFLWLGDHMIGFAAAGSIVGSAGSTNPVTELINEVLPYGIALIFLMIGFFAALSTSAMGSAGVIAGARSIGRAAPGAIGGFAGKKAAGWAGKRWEESATAQRIRDKATRIAETKTPEFKWGTKEAKWNPVKYFKKAAGVAAGTVVTPSYAGARAAGRTVGPGYEDAQKRAIAQAEKDAEDKNVKTVVSEIRSESSWAKKVGKINRLINKPGDLAEALEEGFTLDEVFDAKEQAKKYDAHKVIERAIPQLSHETMRNVGMRKGISTWRAYQQEIFRKIRTAEQAKRVSETVFEKRGVPPGSPPGTPLPMHAGTGTRQFVNAEAMEALVRTWDSRQFGAFLSVQGQDGANSIIDRARQLAQYHNPTAYAANGDDATKRWILANAPGLEKYGRSNAGVEYFGNLFQ